MAKRESVGSGLMRGWRVTGIVAALLCLVGVAADAFAERERGRRGSERRELSQERPGIGPERAAGIVRQATGGRVLGVRPSDGDGYDVKVLTPQGRVSVRRVDGRTGAVDR